MNHNSHHTQRTFWLLACLLALGLALLACQAGQSLGAGTPPTLPPTETALPLPPSPTVPPPASATPTPAPSPTALPPTEKPSVLIQLGPEGTDALMLVVVEGEYRLAGGSTLWAGSVFPTQEEHMTFNPGLAIDVVDGPITLKGVTYPAGSRLFVNPVGKLVLIGESPADAPQATAQAQPSPEVQATPAVEGSPAANGADTIIQEGALMALIPEGSFLMGSDDSSDQLPIHEVRLGAFYMDVYEVTNAFYAACVKAGACTKPSDTGSVTRPAYYGNPEFANYPVIEVDWYQAVAYCTWRGAQLPTEAQWEKAARGGLEGKTYPWGDQDPTCEQANFLGKDGGESPCLGDTAEVGNYAANGYGLFDMAGNVEEWVSSLFLPYPYDPGDGREDLQVDGDRILKDAGWDSIDWPMRVAYRYGMYQLFSFNNTGFRCALPAE